ncbi:MAG: CRISPR-associated protein Cas5 [Bacteroidota bacterium]|jgi:CRISPR-associated protein Cas5h
MDIIAFDIRGKMAHFRKYYANNTAFSYSLPPRTTVTGMLAGMLGMARDSYHEAFALDKIRIGVRILNPVKKSFHRVNFLRIESLGDVAKDNLGDFTGRDGRIQTPFEIISGFDLGQDWVTYRIYLSCYDAGRELFERLQNQLLTKRKHYNLCLGTANFSAEIQNVQTHYAGTLPKGEWVAVHTAVAVSEILRLDSDKIKEARLEEELLPLEFTKNGSRELKTIHRFLFSTNGQPLYAQFKCPIFRIVEQQQPINFLFLEK